jgi:pimeloyl-ACP methyl ester carboxylesterase
MPDPAKLSHTFENIARVIARFTEVRNVKRFAIDMVDYGSPVGLRVALQHADRFSASVSQNGNADEDGRSDAWNPISAYCSDAKANRDVVRSMLLQQRRHGKTEGSSDMSLASGAPKRLEWRKSA